METFRPTVLGLGEVDYDKLAGCHFAGYSLLQGNQSIQNKRMRCNILIKDDISYEEINIVSEVPTCGVHVCCWNVLMVYREWQVIGDPDSNKVKNQVERWKTLLPKLSNLTGNSCIFGDFNYCILNPCTDYQRQFDEIRDGTYVMLLLDGWAQMLETETRFQRGDKPSLLDHIYVNEIKYLERLYNRSLINSDHKVIGARIYHDGQVHQPKTRDFRNIKGIEVDKFETSFKQKNLWKIFYEGDPDKALWRLTTKITQTLDELAPKRKRLCQTRGKEWIDDDMQALFDQRTVLHDTAKSSGSQDDWDVYKRFRNYVRNIARKTKDNFTRIFLNSDKDQDLVRS